MHLFCSVLVFNVDVLCPPWALRLLAPRVERSVYLLEVLPVDAGVDLRRRDVGVTQHLLDHPEVRPALEQETVEGVGLTDLDLDVLGGGHDDGGVVLDYLRNDWSCVLGFGGLRCF